MKRNILLFGMAVIVVSTIINVITFNSKSKTGITHVLVSGVEVLARGGRIPVMVVVGLPINGKTRVGLAAMLISLDVYKTVQIRKVATLSIWIVFNPSRITGS